MARILIVEDEAAIAQGLQDDLELEGYEVEAVADGDTAVTRIEEAGDSDAFDLVLLDVMLPGRDGYQVCRELRRSGCRVPVIILTAKAHEAEVVLGLELGADDYVTKPFSPLELRARIKALLRRAEDTGPAGEILGFGEFELDLRRFELRRAGRTLDLTPLELRLLATFLRNRGRALSRQLLLDEVWGTATYVTDRVVDTHVANLRKKIEDDPEEPRRLVSIRGVGYRFEG